jgi:Family of unknown function (DUF6152)
MEARQRAGVFRRPHVSGGGRLDAMKMKNRLASYAVVVGLLSSVAPLFAHHSTAMYDMANPVTVTGTVKRFEWTNPHAFIFIDVKDEKGNVVEWEIELMSLNHLRSYGWMRDTVKSGDTISCTGGRAKSGAASMISAMIKLPDGREIKS